MHAPLILIFSKKNYLLSFQNLAHQGNAKQALYSFNLNKYDLILGIARQA